jgi:NAD(P)-dependent dehydrogenase (short-subunit alcohol dehydrogenase family)
MQEWILVAGAASGIGRQTALDLYGAGYDLLLVDMNQAGLDVLHSRLPGAHIMLADLTLEAEAARIAEFIRQKGLTLCGVVDTVGKAVTMPFRTMNAAFYEDILATNVYSFQILVSELLKADVFSTKSASVVVVSSITGETGAKGKAAYGASKGALNALVRAMAVELAPQNIRVNAVSPGTIQSEMLDRLASNIGSDNLALLKQSFPLGIGLPEDVSGSIVFLLSHFSGWMTGSVLMVDGGYSAK